MLIRKGGLVLGSSRRDDHDDWGLPGGKLEPGESPRVGAARELLEETGIRVRPEDLEEVFRREEGSWMSVTYEATTWDGDPVLQPGEGLVDWVRWTDIERGSFGAYNRALHAAVKPLFLDLAQCCEDLSATSTDVRLREFVANVEAGVYVTAVGGFPITGFNWWCGSPVSKERVQAEILKGLGVSGVLTHMNRSNLSLQKLGDICLHHGHDWAFRWMTISLLFVGYDLEAELAFARDGRFPMSWPVTVENDPPKKAFVATGSIKDWLKYTRLHNDKSFDVSTRRAMLDAADVLAQLVPKKDPEQHFLTLATHHEKAIAKLNLRDRRVLEIGTGYGELTRLILLREPSLVVGYEIERGLCKIRFPNFFLVEGDVREADPKQFEGWCLIANPPYSLLPWIRKHLLPVIPDILLLIPQREQQAFPGFNPVALVPGNFFTPPSTGSHLLIQRGFE